MSSSTTRRIGEGAVEVDKEAKTRGMTPSPEFASGAYIE
jgi:hypothetical protein